MRELRGERGGGKEKGERDKRRGEHFMGGGERFMGGGGALHGRRGSASCHTPLPANIPLLT